MARSDRLIQLIQILRDGRLHRAQDLANTLGISLRTVYRDMDTLAASGVPVEGARGIGYRVTAAITLPPLNLTREELEALHLGLSVLGSAEDATLKTAAASLSAKIDAVLPADHGTAQTSWGLAVYPFADVAKGFQHMAPIRAAIGTRQKLEVTTREDDGGTLARIIRPLEMDYWGRVWTVTCWCEATGGFAQLRLDRMETLKVLPTLFVEEDGKGLADWRTQKDAV